MDVVQALIREAAKRPHYMWSNEETENPQQSDLEEYEKTVFKEIKQINTPIVKQDDVVQSWKPKIPQKEPIKEVKFTNAEKSEIMGILMMSGVKKKDVEAKMKNITPRVWELHNEIDKWVAIIQGGARTTVAQKQEAVKHIGDCQRELQKLGVIVSIEG